MKKLLLLTFCLLSMFSRAQDPFVTTWEVTAGDLTIHLPINDFENNYTYNYNINYGDGTVLNNVTSYDYHTYNSPGIYTVSVTGTFPHMNFAGPPWGDLPPHLFWGHKLLSVEQWGDIQWQDMSYMFFECQNLVINATDSPDLSQVTNMDGMFYNAQSMNADLSDWNFTSIDYNNFLDYSGMDSDNYDLLLNRFVQLGLNDGVLGAQDIEHCDVLARQQLIENGWSILDSGLADDCNFNYVSGHVKYDLISDGCTMDDNPVSNYMINVNDGNDDTIYDINENGLFTIGLDTGTYALSILNLNSNFTSTPQVQNINFINQNEILENIDFCISASQQFEDLSVDIFPLEDAIPGFETDYQIIVANNGTHTIPNVQVSFAYDDNFSSFVSSTEIPAVNTTNLLTFDFTNLEPFSSEIFEITMINAIPPTLNGGEILTFTAQVTPDANDINPDDNTAIYDQTVVNSFDPNDKIVVQGDEIPDEDIDQYLDYRIRFQNLGTANALNVKITDTISNDLDWTTFQPITSSHDYRIEIVDGEQINYYFDNINLPFEMANPEGSNGYITYKIKPKPTVQIGDIIENTAYIYFDFNLPIVTNTATTTVIDNLSTTSFETDQIRIYPNPVDDLLNLEFSAAINVISIRLYDLNGKLIKTFENQTTLDLSQIGSGIYILSVETDKGSFHEKVIKR